MWGSRKDKRFKKGTKASDAVEGGGPSYSRGGAKLAEQLKHALKHQVAGSQEIRQEMKDLNAAFENEVALRKEATAEMEQLRHQLSILNSKVMGFEQQLQDEKRKTTQLESGMPMPSSVPASNVRASWAPPPPVASVRASWAPPPPVRARGIAAPDPRRASERLPPPPAVDKRRVSAVLPVPLTLTQPQQRPVPQQRALPLSRPPASTAASGEVPPLALAPPAPTTAAPSTAPAAFVAPAVPSRQTVATPPPPPLEATATPAVAPAEKSTAPLPPPRDQRAPPPRPPVDQRRVSETLPAPLTKLPSPTGQVIAPANAPQKHVVRGGSMVSMRGGRGWSSGTLRAPRSRPAPVRPSVQF